MPLTQRKNAQYVLLHLKYGLGLLVVGLAYQECQLYGITGHVSCILPGMSI